MSTIATTPTSIRRDNCSRSTSRTRLPSRPTTPLRPSSRASLRNSQNAITSSADEAEALLSTLEPAFAELSDGMADLEANLLHMQLMHESLARFSESFASFLYGMNMNAFCVDFPEAPVLESFRRVERMETQERFGGLNLSGGAGDGGIDNTFATTDTSFVEHPPVSSKASSKFGTPKAPRGRATLAQTTRGSTRGRGIPRASGIARGVGRGRGRGTTK